MAIVVAHGLLVSGSDFDLLDLALSKVIAQEYEIGNTIGNGILVPTV
jgi:hypothetical protein